MKIIPLTIVIPTFNAARLIARCLDSVVYQSHRPLEVLVIDGNSTDDTMKVVESYTQRWSFVRCASEPDLGIYDAMNKGLSQCTGEWVYFLGADDQLHNPRVLETVCRHFSDGVDFLYGDVFNATKQQAIGEPFDRDKLFGKTICHQAIFYRNTLLMRVGNYNLDYRVCADWDMNIRCFAAQCRPRYLSLTICTYGGDGFSSKITDEVFLQHKLSVISRLYKASFWNNLFLPLRYDFYDRAASFKKEGRLLTAIYFFIIYLYHGARAKIGVN